jgi:DNA invertase Pin-like site-specific DNA recombinase
LKKITKIERNTSVASEQPKLRVAAYCRVSTDDEDQLFSLDAQIKHYDSYIKQNPEWEFAGLYYDKGITGTKKEKRPEFLRLITDCESKRIDLIVTKSISRFSRNTTDCLEVVRRLIDLHVFVYFEKENIHTGSMESELMLSILSGLAANESTSISENNKWSVKQRFQNGTFRLSSPPYGYDSIEGKLVINEDQAKTIRMIFSMTLAGFGVGKIAKELNRLKIPTKRSQFWNSSTILGILQNEKYVGDALFQKTFTDACFKRHLNTGERDFYQIKDNHPAIISRADFDAVQTILLQRRKEKSIEKQNPKYQNRYPFSGKILCFECGGKFKRRIHAQCQERIAWCCSTHLFDSDMCSMKFILESNLEYTFVTMMNKLIFGHTIMLKPLLISLRGMSTAEEKAKRKKLEKQLDEITEQRNVLLGLMSKGYLEPAAYTKGNNQLISDAKHLQSQCEQINRLISSGQEYLSELNALLHFVSKASMLEHFDAELFSRFVKQIHVYSRCEVGLELKCGLILRERVVEE